MIAATPQAIAPAAKHMQDCINNIALSGLPDVSAVAISNKNKRLKPPAIIPATKQANQATV